jgi:hypothetical protein
MNDQRSGIRRDLIKTGNGDWPNAPRIPARSPRNSARAASAARSSSEDAASLQSSWSHSESRRNGSAMGNSHFLRGRATGARRPCALGRRSRREPPQRRQRFRLFRLFNEELGCRIREPHVARTVWDSALKIRVRISAKEDSARAGRPATAIVGQLQHALAAGLRHTRRTFRLMTLLTAAAARERRWLHWIEKRRMGAFRSARYLPFLWRQSGALRFQRPSVRVPQPETKNLAENGGSRHASEATGNRVCRRALSPHFAKQFSTLVRPWILLAAHGSSLRAVD